MICLRQGYQIPGGSESMMADVRPGVSSADLPTVRAATLRAGGGRCGGSSGFLTSGVNNHYLGHRKPRRSLAMNNGKAETVQLNDLELIRIEASIKADALSQDELDQAYHLVK
jgi:hypothetical protein